MVRNAQKRNVSLEKKLKQAEQLIHDGSWDSLADMPQTGKDFLLSHFRNIKRSKFHRQYTLRDKVFALALYKRSAGAYNFMQEIFSLPGRETLRKLITSVPIEPGLCQFLFQAVSKKLNSSKGNKPHYCVLLFDETSLEPNLEYNPETGTVDGFADNGYERTAQIANHATVWMLKGVEGDWKQPILYSFCYATAKWEDIVRTYKDIVREAARFGLIIISSICDQGATNVRASNYLVEASKRDAFHRGDTPFDELIIIDGQIIVPLFDPPHLLKCLRNNLLSKCLRFNLSDGVERIAKWPHIEIAYAIDRKSGFPRAMKKLTDFHVVKEKISKMKVKYCAQVFSNSVASVMALMSRSGAQCSSGEFCMPSAGQDTAKLLEFVNNLFDSVNGTATHKAMTSTTASDDDWNCCIKVLKTMSYIRSKPGDIERPIVLKNWIKTIQGFKYLKKYLQTLGYREFSTRVFNQDSLENFFGQVKQHGVRNTKPNCKTFRAHYKTLLLKSFSQTKNKFNCESDETSSFIVDIENSMTAPSAVKHHDLPPPSIILKGSDFIHSSFDLTFIKDSIHRFIKNCPICQKNIFSYGATGCSKFDEGLSKIGDAMPYYMSQYIHIHGFGKIVTDHLTKKAFFAFEQCEHTQDLLHEIVTKCVTVLSTQYLKRISNIMTGRESVHSKHTDNLVLQAQKLYNNRSSRRATQNKKS